MKKETFFLIFIIIGVFLFFVFLAWWRWSNEPSCAYLVSKKECPTVALTIEKGESIAEIATDLKKKNLIRSELYFKIRVLILKNAKKIQAGEYDLSQGEETSQLAQLLTKGSFDRKFTIIEGWRAEEIGESLLKKGFNINLEEWDKEIKRQNLEGFLFPDTYMLPKTAGIKEIIEIFTKNFENKFDKKVEMEALAKGIDKQSVLILASIIEREVNNDNDRPIIAGILLKRLEKDWALQADATIQYAIGNLKCKKEGLNSALSERGNCEWWVKRLTNTDLSVNSPYNTYLYRGLPPGPICNPGISSIKAVIYSEESLYWFYLSDQEGKIHYAIDDNEQAENIKKFLRN